LNHPDWDITSCSNFQQMRPTLTSITKDALIRINVSNNRCMGYNTQTETIKLELR